MNRLPCICTAATHFNSADKRQLQSRDSINALVTTSESLLFLVVLLICNVIVLEVGQYRKSDSPAR
jgi:high-affinity nickel permease